ncbi:Stk1 family PASTA domain-containing Ser/Thr kinase [Xylanimonas oleitrophica]|nr:Stk1 family PASTA domain-containing Ser/Thr kinase [Xylanimonas oleitrophica]
MVTTDPLIGRLVDGRYEIRARIARGGMATVYLALDRRLEREVALKVMHPHLAEGVEGAAFVSRFRREARAAARLTHPGVVAVYDQGLDGDTSYLTMEYVPGSNLRRELRTTGTLTLGRTLDVLAQVLGALAAAHRKGLVHRDVKPENVLITADDGRVKVADFGLARAVTEVTTTATGTILGTIGYLAPEVIATGACDARTDVYAVGVLAYEMLTGTLPHDGSTPIQVAFQHVHADVPAPSTHADWLPAQVDELVAGFTARDPGGRPLDAGAALEALRRVRLTLEAISPDLLERRADPPAGFVPPSEPAADDADQADDAPPEDDDDAGDELDAIPAGAFTVAAPATTTTTAGQDAGPLSTWFGDNATEQLVERPTVAVAAGAPAARRPRGRRVLGSVLTVLLVLGGGGSGTWWWFAEGPGAWTAVPAGLQGLPLADAQERLATAQLDASTEQAHHDDVPAGAVVATEPGEGERVRKDGTVRLVVSLGVLMVTVPDGLVGASEQDATQALQDAGLEAGRSTQEYSDTVPAGQVLAASQEPGAEVPHDTPIALVVSGGPAPVTVPQQVGRDREEAQAALEELGLQVRFTPDEASETVPAGQVIRQSPENGTRAHRLDTVMLTVSDGPPVVAVPDVVGQRSADARTALQEAGFQVKENKYLGGLLDTVRFQDTQGEAQKGSTVTLTIW